MEACNVLNNKIRYMKFYIDEDGGLSALRRLEELRSKLADSKDAEDEVEAEEDESDEVPSFEEFMRMMSEDEE